MKVLFLILLPVILVACSAIEPIPFEPSTGHVLADEVPADDIPAIIDRVPVLPEPSMPEPLERYTVVVSEAPVKEVLFALARDAKLNIDISSEITGKVTVNAVEQTLAHILDRLANQADLRYEFSENTLLITADTPYFKIYTVDYINLSRFIDSRNMVATSLATNDSVAGGEGGGAFSGNNATLSVSSKAAHELWENVTDNIRALIGESTGGKGLLTTESVIPVPEAGVVSVRATARQHKLIQQFLDTVLVNLRRQVLIQVTMVEVRLSKSYQAGIDWGILNNAAVRSGVDVISTTLPGDVPIGTVSSLVLRSEERQLAGRGTSLSTTIRLLDEFGDVTVISSPQLMVLNNQTAILKRIEQKVFFTFDTDVVTPSTGSATTTVDTIIHSLPVGIVMNITPHISNSGEVILHVRPTISRESGVNRFIPLPENVTLPAGASNSIPEVITQEMESLIRLNSGEIAVLGGLMENSSAQNTNEIPGVGDVELFGNLFRSKTKQFEKVEIVTFLRPVIVADPSIDGDLKEYKTFLMSAPYPGEAQGR